MKILLISDEECPFLWDYFKPERLEGIDLIISCGDLKAEYLSFLVTMSTVPVLYVHGNHDDRYETNPPEGCESLEDRITVVNGLRILGLGGSYRYGTGVNQYTEKEMTARIHKLRWQLWRHKGVDIVVSHAPVRGLGDGEDLPHRGFDIFRTLLDKYQPRYWFYGHMHMSYNRSQPRILQHGSTTLINACERYVLDV